MTEVQAFLETMVSVHPAGPGVCDVCRGPAGSCRRCASCAAVLEVLRVDRPEVFPIALVSCNWHAKVFSDGGPS